MWHIKNSKNGWYLLIVCFIFSFLMMSLGTSFGSSLNGLPGDVITIKNGQVYVNGTANGQDYTLDGYTSGYIDKLVVPDGEVFVLGDNRLNSIDSREIGTQKIEDVKGVAFVRLWPLSKAGGLD